MTSRELRAAIASWLRYERQVPLIAFERGADVVRGIPDILAVTKDRFLLEVEIKISMKDFRRDAEKDKFRRPDSFFVGHKGDARLPAFFYYAIPPEMIEKVKPILPKGAGLVTWGNGVEVIVPPQRNKAAARVSIRQLILMVRHQSGTLVSLEKENSDNQRKSGAGITPTPPSEPTPTTTEGAVHAQ